LWSKRIHELIFDDILAPLVVVRQRSLPMSMVRKGMWGVLLLGCSVLAFLGPSSALHVPEEEKLYDASAWDEDANVWDGRDERYLDEWDDDQPYNPAWRSGEVGTDENPLLVACWDGPAPGEEFEGNISRVVAEKNLSMRVVSLGRVPETSCGAFEAEPTDSTDAEEAYAAWARDASSTWAEVLSSPSLGDQKVTKDAPVKTLTLVECFAGEESGDEPQLEPFCEWLHMREDWDDYPESLMDSPDGAGEGEEATENDEEA